ncbi:MAG: hypothetical protein ACE37E_01280 [Hyphomicrobiales bacterium]
MTIVPNARRAWRWFSVQAMVLATAIQGAWVFIPPDLKERTGDDLASIVTGAILVLGVVGRMVSQEPRNDP